MDAGSPTRAICEDLSENEEESFCLEQPRGATPRLDRSFGFGNGSFIANSSPQLMEDIGDGDQRTIMRLVRIPSLEGMSPIAMRRRPPPTSSCGDTAHGGLGIRGKSMTLGSDVKAKKQTSTPITGSMRCDSKTPQVSSVVFETPGTSEFGAGEPSRFVDSREIVALSIVDDSIADSDNDDCEGDIVPADDAQPIDCSYVWLFDEDNPSKTL